MQIRLYLVLILINLKLALKKAENLLVSFDALNKEYQKNCHPYK